MSQTFAAVQMVVRYRRTPCIWREVAQPNGHPPSLVSESSRQAEKLSKVDVWTLRNDFFSIRTVEQMFDFLKHTGRFAEHQETEWWSYEDFETWRTILSSLLSTKPEKWRGLIEDRFPHSKESGLAAKFEGRFAVQFERHGSGYVGVITVQNTLMAMIASIYVDWMSGVKQGFCERRGCNKPFAITSSHRRNYCSHTCGHYETMRRSRDRMKEAKKNACTQPVSPLDKPIQPKQTSKASKLS